VTDILAQPYRILLASPRSSNRGFVNTGFMYSKVPGCYTSGLPRSRMQSADPTSNGELAKVGLPESLKRLVTNREHRVILNNLDITSSEPEARGFVTSIRFHSAR